MRVGDLIYLKHKQYKDEHIALIVGSSYIGTKRTGTFLYDILFTETNEVITISDINFEIWRINETR